VPLGKLSLAAIVTPLLHLLPDPAPRLNGDQRSDSCRHKGKPNKYHQVKIAGLRQNGFATGCHWRDDGRCVRAVAFPDRRGPIRQL
jgi:hypothetical protein